MNSNLLQDLASPVDEPDLLRDGDSINLDYPGFLNAGQKMEELKDNEDTLSLSSFKEASDKFEQENREKKKNMSKSSLKDDGDSALLLNNVPNLSYQVREYQGEIFEKSKDKNSIILLETGSGKTIISLLHILHCLKKENAPKKIAFLCLQINLVEQQTLKVRSFLRAMQLREEFRYLEQLQPTVITLHGGKGDDGWKHISGVLRRNNPLIMVMTPQYLLNGLRKGYVKLEEFSLIVFDECHHCTQQHPYNLIMQEFYHKPWLENTRAKPQILGLTATPITVTKQINTGEIEQKLLQICHNLDSNFCTLEVNKIEEGQKSEAEIQSFSYPQDAQLDDLDILAEADQRRLTSLYKGIDIINNWNLALTEIFECLDDQETGEEVMPAQMRMSIEDFFKSKIANRAIALYLELGQYAVYLHFLDIYEQLEDVMNGFGFTTLDVNKLKRIRALLQAFLKKIGNFRDSSKLSEKCLTILKLLNAVMKENPDNTGIVFVERKYIARVLKKIINSKIPGDHVKAEYIIGHNYFGLTTTDEDKGDVDPDLEPSISSTAQRIRPLGEIDDVKKEGKHFKKLFNPRQTLQTQLQHIDLFKKGKFNVLIATSLIQEGFDVPNCNFVVSLSEPKTILQMVQIRGRARMLGSKYYILLPKNTEEEKMQKFSFGLMLMGRIKKIAAEFERQISSDIISNANRSSIPEAISENGGRLNTNWADALTTLLCRSIPSTSLDYNKPFYLVIGHTQGNKGNRAGFTSIILLPNQCNVRIKRGEMYPNKNDAKKSAAFLCCKQLMNLEYFDKYLNPKSMNKDYSEFVDIKIDPLSGKFQSDFIERLNSLYQSSNSFSHFAKPFLKITEEIKEGEFNTYGGFLYHIKISKDSQETNGASEEDLTLCLIHPSRLPDNFQFSKKDCPAIKLVFIKEIYFSANEYKDMMLIHRYLISFADTQLLQFFSTLTGDPPQYLNIEEKKLDYEYELWIAHQPTLSFFVATTHKFELATKFNSILKEYIQYQSKFYLYLNSVNYQDQQITSLWNQPKIQYSCYQTNDPNELTHYVLQDVWRLGNYQLNQVQDLSTVDYYASSDGLASLQHRAIFFIDRFLEKNSGSEYEKGFEVIDLKDKTQKIFFDIELMMSPISIQLYKQLRIALTAFQAFPQSKLSLRTYQEDLARPVEYDPPRALTCNLDLSDFIDIFSFFQDQCLREQHFFRQPDISNTRILAPQELPRYKKGPEDIESIEKTLEDIFVIENNTVEDASESRFEVIGSRLIDLLLSIEVFLANPNEWDYSLEKIKKKKLSKWKKASRFLTELTGLFVSARGNNLLCDAIITEIDRDQGKVCAEYIARSALSKIIKNTAYLLYEKESGKLERVRKFLCKAELLDYEKLEFSVNGAIQQGQSVEALRHMYNFRHMALEQMIGYSFKDKFILMDALVEMSFRDYFVEWIEKEGPLADSLRMLELRKTVFQQKGEEYSVPANNGLSIDQLFPQFIEEAINDYHKRPGDLDRFKWLGQALMGFIVLEWLQETFSDKMSALELDMYAKYISETQFVTYLSWTYNLEDYIITHKNCYDLLKRTKSHMRQKDLLTRSVYLDQGNFMKKKLCYISASLFYSLIAAIFLDSRLDLNRTRDTVLALIVPIATDCIKKGFIQDFAPFKLEKICEKKGWPKPMIKKASLSEQESYRNPASSQYQLLLGDKMYSSIVDSSLKNVEYTLYVTALEKLEGQGF